jgi:DNA polymerase-3 subunit delta
MGDENNNTTNAAQKPLLPLYAILSGQFFLREQTINRLKKRLSAEGDLDFNSDQFDATALDVDAVLCAANTLPFACAYRLVLVTNIHQAKKEVLDALGTYAQSPSPTTVLVVMGEKLAKTTKLYKAIARLGGVVERTTPKKKELPAIVGTLFATRDKDASFDICRDLVESVGEDLEALDTAVAKMATYMGERTVATREDVRAMVETSVEVKVWDLTDALLDRRASDALSLFNLLLQQSNSVFRIQSAVVRTLRELIVVRSCIDDGDDSPSRASSALGKPDWIARRMLDGARRYSARELHGGLAGLAHVEYTLKTSNEGEAAYRRWIIDFAGAPET